jgi:hypothetical protein
MKTCPKCKQKTDAEQCGACKIVFAEYEQRKQEQTAQVYTLISAGELEQAKQLAQSLSNEFPDSKGDFVLLISNINRDLNIADKYRQAQELFNRGEYAETILLLRNIKAFDPGLAEKIITLRRRAERHSSHSSKFEQALMLIEQKQHGQARTLLLQMRGDSRRKDEIEAQLAKIEEFKSGLLREIAGCLGGQLFNAAREKLVHLTAAFPETEQEQSHLFALLEKQKEISARLTAAAHKAREERRFIEAKVLYAFLVWQDEELKPALVPYLEEIGSKAEISLADCDFDPARFAALGLSITAEGFLKKLPTEKELNSVSRIGEHLPKIAPVFVAPESLPDIPDEPADIDGQEVADFA